MSQRKVSVSLRAWLVSGVSASAVSLALFGAAYAQDNSEAIETVTVTGFRASLEKALDQKRNALDASDSILAEDIAKFPDMNVSESLQRIPGVAISREAGEGRQITVRGLGAQFTRVRINGMEVIATTTGSDATGGKNRGSSFDFNVFASEIFSQLTVHKSMSADLEEGSLGATVDMHASHPFDHSGPVFTISGQYGYQEIAGSSNPRFAFLASNTYLGGRLGVLISGAYSTMATKQVGASTVRWYNDGYDTTSSSPTDTTTYGYATVNGTAYSTATGADNSTYLLAARAFHPRFPRYDVMDQHKTRIGLTGSVQWQPDDNTLFTLDAMYADFSQIRQSSSLEAEAFSVAGSGTTYAYTDSNTGSAASVTTLAMHNINLINFDASDIDSTNSLTKLQATNVGLRSEGSLTHADTRFMQVTLDGTHDVSDKFKVHAMMGWAESHFRTPIDINITSDLGCINSSSSAGCTTGGAGTDSQPYEYDYSKGGYPYISYGNIDVTSPDGWFLSRISMNRFEGDNAFRTAVMDAKYAPFEWLNIEGGFNYRNFAYQSISMSRSNGTTSSQIYNLPNDVRSTSISEYARTVNLGGISVPSGTPTSWWAPNITKAINMFDLLDQDAYSSTGSGNCSSGCGAWHMGIEPSVSSNGTVNENDYGFWMQVNWDTEFYNVPLRGNVGARYVLTETNSIGYVYNSSTKTADPSEKAQTYHDWLPSLNVIVEPAENFLIRFNASYAISRPDLTKMLPGGSVSGTSTTRSVSITNPTLKPIRSKNMDIAFEWYYHKGAMLSIAGFYKHIDSTIQTIKSDIVYHDNPYGLSDDLAIAACGNAYGSSCNEYLVWTFSVPVNKPGGPLYGTEINWQQPFDFLPGDFANTGFLGNVTYVQAQQNYYNTSGAVDYTADLEGLSRTSYNATVYYDDGTFQARATAAFRGHYALSTSTNNLNKGNWVRSAFNLDASASYNLDDHVQFTFNAINLTNQRGDIYTDATAERLYELKETGSTYYFGVKYSY